MPVRFRPKPPYRKLYSELLDDQDATDDQRVLVGEAGDVVERGNPHAAEGAEDADERLLILSGTISGVPRDN